MSTFVVNLNITVVNSSLIDGSKAVPCFFQAGFQASASMSGGVLEGASPSIEWGGFGTCLPLIEWGRFAVAYTPVEVIYELLTFIGGWTWKK